MSPHQIHVHLEPQNRALLGNRVFANVIKVRTGMRSYGLGSTLNMSIPIRDKKGLREHSEESHMKSEAEVGMMHPQTKECLGPPEAGRVKEGFTSRDFRGNIVLPTF